MRLLNCKTKRLQEFGEDLPTYAILSHTWERDELSFDQIVEAGSLSPVGVAINGVAHMQGWFKIDKACEEARKDGYDYVWIDTVCINRSSSAELSEAINSMFKWYQGAAVCYAYLSDVGDQYSEHDRQDWLFKSFEHSRWFSRGWTLQELIAPKSLHFFDHSWTFVGSKRDRLSELSRITGVDMFILSGGSLRLASVARILSWAARRQTTRREDRAYSLLGLFDISMPLIYGEDDKAFLRLQEELIKQYDDQSLFAWTQQDDATAGLTGILARSADDFAASVNIYPVANGLLHDAAPPTVTSRGIQFNTVVQWLNKPYLLLNCHDVSQINSSTPRSLIGIEIGWLGSACFRSKPLQLCYIPSAEYARNYKFSSKIIMRSYRLLNVHQDDHSLIFMRNVPLWPDREPYTLAFTWPRNCWAETESIVKLPLYSGDSYSDCLALVFQKPATPSTISATADIAGESYFYFVVYLLGSNTQNEIGIHSPSSIRVAARFCRTRTALDQLLETYGSLRFFETSPTAIEIREERVRLNVHIFSLGPAIPYVPCLDIFAHEDYGPPSYSVAEEWGKIWTEHEPREGPFHTLWR